MCRGEIVLLVSLCQAISCCVQGWRHDFNVFAMNGGRRFISIEQDADAINVDAPSNNRAGLAGKARAA